MKRTVHQSEHRIMAEMSDILDIDDIDTDKTTTSNEEVQIEHRTKPSANGTTSRKSSIYRDSNGSDFNDIHLDDTSGHRTPVRSSKPNGKVVYPTLPRETKNDRTPKHHSSDSEEERSGSCTLLMSENENMTVENEAQFLEKLQCNSEDLTVKCLSIIGNTGDGKSYTLNQVFFDGEEKFHISSSTDSCTIGVWAALDPSRRTLLLDTEGRLGFSQNDNVRNRLLLKILCISDIVIYRTRAPRLPNDMFQFLSDASNAFHKFFRREIENVMRTNQIEGPISTMGPTLIIFHETQHTDVLREDFKAGKTAVEQVKERFDKMKLSYDAYSSIEYVGTQTGSDQQTNFDGLKKVVTNILENNNIRSPRRLSIIFRALKALNEKFNHTIPPDVPSTLPDDFFSCFVKCLSCGTKCTMTSNHQKDGISHQCDKQCAYVTDLDNEVWKCLACHRSGRDTTVYGKLITKNDGLVQGLIRYVWSGYVIECPHHGEIYRSRKYWYGNRGPEDFTRVEVIHVWPGENNTRSASDVTPRKLIEALKRPAEFLMQPMRAVGEACADAVAPTYWEQNKDVLRCRICDFVFGSEHSKHHCRGCGRIFCDTCTKRRMIVPNYSNTTPQRVCEACASKLQEQVLSPIYHSNNPGNNDGRLSSEDSIHPTEVISSGRKIMDMVQENVAFVVGMPFKAIRDRARPDYWRADHECIQCIVCSKPFNTTTHKLHHCRRCGEGVCDPCSPGRYPVPERDWNDAQRVCKACENEIIRLKSLQG